MGYYQLVLPRESSWEIMNALGKLHATQAKSTASTSSRVAACSSPSSRRSSAATNP